MKKITFLIILLVLMFGNGILFSQDWLPAPPQSTSSINVRLTASGDEDFKSVVKQIERLLNIYDYNFEGNINFSGEYLRNKRHPSSKTIAISGGNQNLNLTLPEGLLLLRDNPGMASQDLVLIFTESIYDWDGYGDEYRMNRHPCIIINSRERKVQFTVSQALQNVNLEHFPISEPAGYTHDDSPSRIIRHGQEYENHFLLGSYTRAYSLIQKDYDVQGGFNIGYSFGSNWRAGLKANWRNENKEDLGISYVRQLAVLNAELSQHDALVNLGFGFGRYLKSNADDEVGIFFPVHIFGVWVPRSEIRFDGGIEYNLTRDRDEPKPSSAAIAEIRVSPVPWDILGNGQKNNYGIGSEASIFLSGPLAMENVAVFIFIGNKLTSARFPNQELAIGGNYNAKNRSYGLYANLNFNLGVK